MKKIVVVLFMLMTTIVFADPKSEGTTEVPQEKVVTVPGAGPDVVVEVPYVVQRIHEMELPSSELRLRGGLSLAAGFPARTDPNFLAGLVGEIGYTDSPWVLETSFHAGKCKEGVAFDGGLAALRNVASHFRMGVGADLLYCSNVSEHTKEKASDRIVGGSLQLQLDLGHFTVTGSIGAGAATYPIPGDRQTKFVSYQGLTINYLF